MNNDERKIRNVAILALLLCAICTGVAFAALTQDTYIKGAGKIDRLDWNIKFQNLSKQLSGRAQDEGSVLNSNYTIANLSPVFKSPGDKVTYKLDVANIGDIDAKIFGIAIDGNYSLHDVNFSFHYLNDVDYGNKVPEVGDVLLARTSRPLILVVELDSDTIQEPTEVQSFDFTVQMVFVQNN